ncbi:hypothetical protein L195_g008375 [Trifolium pratense]|uniref:Uncharacterized protein n=2 Tax=Trifolium pratense TaxID=57577 RepID=A0ACB0I710_TRIPR|nr:uncharacterized protein LOC123902620 [Trifolium pratense]PNY11760.1 hypothetical protein L195_g008375 [Trifolium pratense]CAJ2627888.1 unnamed protein product [Trifolium pratense]
MKRFNIFNSLTLVLTFLAFVLKISSQIQPPEIHLPPPSLRPLCAPQLALVSYACGMIPFTPRTPPSAILSSPSPPPPNNNEGHQSHHHGHDHKHRHENTKEEDNCCRWAKEMDNRCVCEILLRLPPFLTRPLHQYTVVIGESCNVTYSCGGPI